MFLKCGSGLSKCSCICRFDACQPPLMPYKLHPCGADKLSLTVTLPVADPLFTVKRILLQQHSMATQQTFQLLRDGVRAVFEPYV